MTELAQWQQDAARLNTLCDDTLKAIRTRDRALRTGADASAQVAQIAAHLKTLNSDVAVLEKQLSQFEQDRTISSDELRRHETLVIDLLSYRDRLESLAANNNPRRHERTVRFAETVVTFPPPASVSASASSTGLAGQEEHTAEQLLEVQRRGIELQDQHLDALSHVIGKQKHLAGQIGEELDLQSDLLDDLDEGVQRSQTFLDRASRTLTKVARSAQHDRSTQLVCSLIFIILLIVAVVVLAKLLA